MSQHNDTGRRGEQLAVAFLKEKGYTILHTNWMHHPKELDIVAVYEDMLVVVEVKTRTYPFLIDPLESVTATKIKHLVRATHAYIFKYNIHLDTRFDIVTVSMNDPNYEIVHIQDAFFPSVEY